MHDAYSPAKKPQQPVFEDAVFRPGDAQVGLGTRYAMMFAGRPTASGERMDPNQLTAAHRTLPFGTHVLVTNLSNGRAVEITVNDRGPFTKGRVIDLTPMAANSIGLTSETPVRIEAISSLHPSARPPLVMPVVAEIEQRALPAGQPPEISRFRQVAHAAATEQYGNSLVSYTVPEEPKALKLGGQIRPASTASAKSAANTTVAKAVAPKPSTCANAPAGGPHAVLACR